MNTLSLLLCSTPKLYGTILKLMYVLKNGNDGQNLQNPENRREILCDAKLKTVLQEDHINMFHIAKKFKNHMKE